MMTDKLRHLQELRADSATCIGDYSSVYFWAMCVAINAYIGERARGQTHCVEQLAKALEAEVAAEKQQAAA